jgi:hypothetical protein
MRHAARFILLVTLMRLRTALPLLARLFAVAHVTLWRYCRLATRLLAGMFASPGGATEMIVDTTATRVRCTDRVWHSGHKRQRVAKVQVLCDASGIVHCVSGTYPGSAHDKTIWNGEFGAVPKGAVVLADKAYAGGIGENAVLFRPVKRADWIATRHAFNPSEPMSEIKLFPGAKFQVLSVER